MIILRIISGFICLVLTPLVILLFFIQSKHIVFKIVHFIFIAIYSLILMLCIGNVLSGTIVFILLYFLQLYIYLQRKNQIKSGKGTRYIYCNIETIENHFKLDFIISLVLLYFLEKLPFPLVVHDKKQDTKIDIKKMIDLVLVHGKDTSIDVNSKDTKIIFKIA